jgi:hypothetical protein
MSDWQGKNEAAGGTEKLGLVSSEEKARHSRIKTWLIILTLFSLLVRPPSPRAWLAVAPIPPVIPPTLDIMMHWQQYHQHHASSDQGQAQHCVGEQVCALAAAALGVAVHDEGGGAQQPTSDNVAFYRQIPTTPEGLMAPSQSTVSRIGFGSCTGKPEPPHAHARTLAKRLRAIPVRVGITRQCHAVPCWAVTRRAFGRAQLATSGRSRSGCLASSLRRRTPGYGRATWRISTTRRSAAPPRLASWAATAPPLTCSRWGGTHAPSTGSKDPLGGCQAGATRPVLLAR